jgi:hypothetical protein
MRFRATAGTPKVTPTVIVPALHALVEIVVEQPVYSSRHVLWLPCTLHWETSSCGSPGSTQLSRCSIIFYSAMCSPLDASRSLAFSSSREQARRRVGQLFPMYRLFRVAWQTTINPASRFLLPL